MVVLETFPKLSIIDLIPEKFHKFMYKMREMSHCHAFSQLLYIFLKSMLLSPNVYPKWLKSFPDFRPIFAVFFANFLTNSLLQTQAIIVLMYAYINLPIKCGKCLIAIFPATLSFSALFSYVISGTVV
jgi:hypothetical protein